MARMMDATKRKLWGDRFRRFDGCDLTVADFCLAEGVSTPSFNLKLRLHYYVQLEYASGVYNVAHCEVKEIAE